MPPLLSRAMARIARVLAGTHVRVLAWRGLLMMPAAAVAVLLLPGGISEGTAMPLHLRPFALPASYSNDFTGFPKWRGMMARFARELSDSDAAAGAWGAFAESLRAPDRLAELRAVNAAVNAFPYVTDAENWGKTDFWETPLEFLQRAGDCEDFAVTKYMALRTLGVAVDDMRVAVVDDRQLGVTHAVLLAIAEDRYYVLDNLTDDVVPATAVPFYRPIYAINEHGWWNYGPPPAVSAAGP
jgi:predicted transglutaminase-like cysteine proteinase